MFSLFRKKTQVEKLIDSDGFEHATDRFAEVIAKKLPSREIAYQFILQELDGARLGSASSQRFARNSGINQIEFIGALEKSIPEVDGQDGPQQLLLSLSLQISNQEKKAEFRCRIDENIMRTFGLGKYSPKAGGGTSLDDKKAEIGKAICVAVNRENNVMLDDNGAINIVTETLHKLSEKEILGCKTEVSCLFSMAHLADSAFEDGDTALAKYVSNQCKPIASGIMKLPNNRYSDLEFTMVDSAFDIMKKIDGYF